MVNVLHVAFVPATLMQVKYQGNHLCGKFYLWVQVPNEVPSPNDHQWSFISRNLTSNINWKQSYLSLFCTDNSEKAYINLTMNNNSQESLPKVKFYKIYVTEISNIAGLLKCFIKQKDYLCGEDAIFWLRIYQEIFTACQAGQFFPQLKLKFHTKKKWQLSHAMELISPEFKENRAIYLRAMPSEAHGIQLKMQQNVKEGYHWSPELILDQGIECIVNSLLQNLHTSLENLSQVKENSVYKLLSPSLWSQYQQLEKFNLWKSENVRPNHWALTKLTFLLDPPKALGDDWLLTLGISIEEESETFISLEQFWQMNYPEYPTKFLEHHPLLDLWLLEQLHKAAEYFSPLKENLTEHHQPKQYQLNTEAVCGYVDDTGPELDAMGCITLLPEPLRKPKKVTATMHIAAPKTVLSMESIFEQTVQLVFDGEELTLEELEQIHKARRPLINLRGQWQRIDPTHLDELIKNLPKKKHTSLKEVLALQANRAHTVQAAPKLQKIIRALASPQKLKLIELPTGFEGELRPYQHLGVSWLSFLKQMGMPALLADDMGLGKTVQVLVHLLSGHQEGQKYLLVAPLSLLASWPKEGQKFTPELRIGLHHGLNRARTLGEIHDVLNELDILLTTYGTLRSDIELLHQVPFTTVILDEAQAIKNPLADITNAVTRLNAPHRIALTGTPIENRPLDLWSLFNFLLPNYLGDSRSFRTRFENPIANKESEAPQCLALLQRLVQPFLLRRIKEEVAQELPPKIFINHEFLLTTEQVQLYKLVVEEIRQRLEAVDSKERQTCILSSILHLKQVCNHPAQYLKESASAFTPERSHKMALVLDTIEQCIERGEKVLLFSQFTAVTTPMHFYLNKIGILTYLIEGRISNLKRTEQIERFQSSPAPGVFIISLAAGGAGLNFQVANNVIFFDQPWNPAKENQAMDRAHRIGQLKNVFVHRLICSGTIEERINDILTGKKELAAELLGGVQDESWIGQLSNEKFLDLIRLKEQEGI